MPGFDGSGPNGMGQMSGGGRGYCVRPVEEAGYVRGVRGMSRRGAGRGFARGIGSGLRRGMWMSQTVQPVNKDEELRILKNEAEMVQQELHNLQEHIARLEKDADV